jgi:hypothetical protein
VQFLLRFRAVAALAPAIVLLSCTGSDAPPKPARPAAHATPSPKKAKANPAPSAPAKTAPEAAATGPAEPAAPPKPGLRPQRLADPPKVIKAVYFTSWSAGLRSRMDYLVDLHETTAANAAVFDIKDYSGYLSYRVDVPEAAQYYAIRPTVRDIDELIGRLHRAGIYTIARITVFQDPILAEARPDLAVHRRSKLLEGAKPPLTQATLWRDRKGLAWIDPASRPAWEYIAMIARDALSHGFDELNFDYVRFPSDGDMKDMYFPSWDGKTPKHKVIAKFFAFLRDALPGVPLSADLFGLSTVNPDDLGIGQVIEDSYSQFDYVCPMVYPSHFAKKFLGYVNPAEHPYEVVNYSMRRAVERLELFLKPPAPAAAPAATGPSAAVEPAPAQPDPKPRPESRVKLRPWLQDFNLGAKYDAGMVEAQIKAVQDALGDRYAGYMLWSPSNVYSRAALK